MGKNKKNYKKNYYHKPKNEKKVTYDSLMHAKTITENNNNDIDISKLTIIKYIGITAVLFAIIIGSLLLFRNM